MTTTYELETTVYGMYFQNEGFTVENVRFQRRIEFWRKYQETMFGPFAPADDNKSWVERTGNEDESMNKHHATGMTTVTWNDFDGTLDEAVRKTKSILYDCSRLLSFAHGHHVPFGVMLYCYEGSGATRKWVSTTGLTTRFGNPGIDSLNIRSWGLKPFLQHCFPLLQNAEFVRKTQIIRAIDWYNEIEAYEDVAFEVHFASMWTALEILAGAHAIASGKEKLPSASKVDYMRKGFRDVLQNLGVPEDEEQAWTNKITEHTSVISRIRALFDAYDLTCYSHHLSNLYRLRNQIVHGYPVQVTKDNIDLRFKLRRLMEKSILIILGFYNRSDLIHTAITSENLRAV